MSGIALAVAAWGVLPPMPRIVAFPFAALGAGIGMVALALLLIGLALGAFALPVLALVPSTRSTAARVALAVGGLGCSAVTILGVHALGAPEDVLREKAAPPANCKPWTSNVSAISRPCTLATRAHPGDSVDARGDCPEGYFCTESIGKPGVTSCQTLCSDDCGCAGGTTCRNGTCQRGSDLPP